MSEQVIEKYGINFEERAKQILSTEPILAAKDLEVQFTLRGEKLNAIRKCSLELYDGETLAIVGESGSGKSVFTKCFVGMLDKNGSITGGSILYNGQDLTKFTTEKEWRTIRGGKIAMVTQDPMTSLNPLKKIGVQIQEAIELHQGMRGPRGQARGHPACWSWWVSPILSAAIISIRMSFPAACASAWSSPSPWPAVRRS